MYLRSIAFSAILLSLPVFSFSFPGHHHHHYADLTKGELIEILKEKESELFWKRVETGAIASAAGLLIGYILAKINK